MSILIESSPSQTRCPKHKSLEYTARLIYMVTRKTNLMNIMSASSIYIHRLNVFWYWKEKKACYNYGLVQCCHVYHSGILNRNDWLSRCTVKSPAHNYKIFLINIMITSNYQFIGIILWIMNQIFRSVFITSHNRSTC